MSTPLAPLSAEERAEVRRQLDELRVYTSAIPATGLLSQTIRDMGEAMSRLLAERDSLERERDEARAQIFAAHAERNEADRDLAVAQEQVRSLTVERDAARRDAELLVRWAGEDAAARVQTIQSAAELIRAQADRADESREREANESRARLSRAREALAGIGRTRHSEFCRLFSEMETGPCDCPFGALRAALAEPLGAEDESVPADRPGWAP